MPSDTPAKDPSPETYEDFLTAAIKRFWDQNDSKKMDLLALLLASPQARSVAVTGAVGDAAETLSAATKSGSSLLKGAASATAITMALRALLGGSLGMLLTGVSVASLVALYAKNHERIWSQVEAYERVVDEYRGRFERIEKDYAEGNVDDEYKSLLLEGLMTRLVAQLGDASLPPEESEA